MDPVTALMDQLNLPADWAWLVERRFAGSELWRWGALAAALAVSLLAAGIVRWVLRGAARGAQRRGHEGTSVLLTALDQATLFALLVAGLQIGARFLTLGPEWAAVSRTSLEVLGTLAVAYAVYCLVGVAGEWMRQWSARSQSRMDDMLVPMVRKISRAMVVVLALVQVSTILSDKPVTSVIAGLGVGGLAVGLAAQDTIKAVFGSMVIFADRPFELGDEITADGHTGVVESVGFRSTRFRTGDGHLVTIPNGQLANMTIVNISRRRNLQRKFSLPLAPSLSSDKLRQAREIVAGLLADHEGMDASLPPRVYLSEVTPPQLALSVNYWYHPADRWRFASFNERVNLEILERFAAAGIALAGAAPAPAEPPKPK